MLTVQDIIATLLKQPKFFELYQIKSLAIFGSVARNEATENSDLDILVEFKSDITLSLYMQLKFYLEDLFDTTVDLVIPTDLKPIIKNKVLQEAVYVSPA
jgi:predicted nucleotidyltransferase